MSRRKLVHFVYGFRPQLEPFHLLHHLAIETCRQVVRPDEIIVHCDALPFGIWWDLTRAHVTLERVGEVDAVTAAAAAERLVPARYRHAHHADVVRLDALIAHGGMYADIDTVFLRPVPDAFWEEPFVIGSQGVVVDGPGVSRTSMCNALMMSQPGSEFAQAWRERLIDQLGVTGSGHSGFVAAELAEVMPGAVRVEPPESFVPVLSDAESIRSLLSSDAVDLSSAYSAHLWAHLWWDPGRRDVSDVHAGLFSPEYIRRADTSLTAALAPYVPELSDWPGPDDRNGRSASAKR